MRALSVSIALLLAHSAMAQTMTPQAGGAYDGFVAPTLDCLGATQGDAAAQGACLSDAVDRCMSRAGVYEACLNAVSAGLQAAQVRVQAAACDPLDPACRLMMQGRALIAMGAFLETQTWRDALQEDD